MEQHTDYQIYESMHGLELPEEIKQNYVYTLDGGHSVYCIMKEKILSRKVTTHNYEDYLVPVPIKAVLRKYELAANLNTNEGEIKYLVCVDMEYDSDLGLLFDENDVEY